MFAKAAAYDRKKSSNSMQNKPYYFQMSVKATVTDEGEVRVRGLASTPDLDRYRDRVEPEAFTKSLKQFMRNPVLLRSHDIDRPVGRVESAQVTDKGLAIEAVIKDAEMAEQVKAGLFSAFSIGYIPLKTELHNAADEPLGVEDNPWSWDNIRVIKELDLVEISIVSTPANAGALFTLAKSLKDFGRQLAFKALDLNGKTAEGIPANEVTEPVKPEESTEDEAEEEKVEGEDEAETGAEATEEATKEAPVETEKPAEESKPEEGEEEADEADGEEAGEEKSTEDKTEEKSEESQEDAENSGETTEAEGAEGGKTTEEASADAEPADDEEESEDKSEGKAIVVTKDVAALLPTLKAVGALREQEGEEKATAIPKGVLTLMRKLHDVLVAENKRANDEQKRAEDLQVKLNGTPSKKALAPHRQFAAEDEATEEKSPEAVKEAKKKASLERFLSLFKL